MALLTRQKLNLDRLAYYAEWRDFIAGRRLYEKGYARVKEFEGHRAVCEVDENQRTYLASLQLGDRFIYYQCTCERTQQKERLCRHCVAAVYALDDYLEELAEIDWRYRLEMTLEIAAKTVRKPSPPKEERPGILFFALDVRHLFWSSYTFFLRPFFISLRKWAPAYQVTQSADPAQSAIELLAGRNDWWMLAEQYGKGRAINLSLEAQTLIDVTVGSDAQDRFLGHTPSFPPKYLETLSKLNIPIFLKKGERFQPLLKIHPEPAELQLILSESTEILELVAGLKIGDSVHLLQGEEVRIFSEQTPVWALAKDTLVQVKNPEVLKFLSFFPLHIPQHEAKDFLDEYFARLDRHLPLAGEKIKWETLQTQPVPRLYISKEADGPIQIELRFGYGDYEFPSAGTKPVLEETIRLPDQWGGLRVIRDGEAERRYFEMLKDARYGLKRAGADRPGVFELRAHWHPFDFLVKSVPALTEAGFEIFGDKNIAKINRHKPILSLNISSGIDWFDVQTIVHYGDQQVSLNEIRKALKRGERYIKLADGSVGQIPEEWLERYKHLFNLAEEIADGLRIQTAQLPLLDELLAEAEIQNIAPEFHAKRERLKSFEGISEHPLPKGFYGELRPYQKAGYDWLHFLHEYGFGGILADDMGLGKTVQALAFLLALKERGELLRPTLLVVPKSLLVNWQREAARFTPDLRLLDFMGQTRKKDPVHFDGYDLVITTYGTMLRDIEFLRQYRFSYVILDESQAIKNPLAQTSKAVRLLQADHRLCLTGTPVENNVYELWSQFAFLNPGLLGSLEYFRSEFASAIEQRGEAAHSATQLLRKLVYPFILRRTKEQVALELPPRTERVIYTELSPAQRKLYEKTRDYYRGLLLGMLEEGEDINDIRFKILEGLLRMRQVCIHPRLVEPTYRGDSAKFEILLETLETLQAEGHKALIFSQFVQALSLLRQELDSRGMVYAYLDGQTQNRQEQVDRFQSDPNVPLFLISLKAGGVGLNLTAADYVLHLDPWWNPAVEMQAADRAHRIGQDKPVFVYKFIARDTVEEKILQLQKHKRELVEQLISAESDMFKSLTKEDVQVLFS